MKGRIGSIEEKETDKGKRWHLIEIEGERYSCWDANMVAKLPLGGEVEFEFKQSGDFKVLINK